MQDVIQKAWVCRLSCQNTDDFLHRALTAATQFHFRQLLGRAYYIYLGRIEQSMSTAPAATAGPACPIPPLSGSVFPNPDGLAAEHMLHLFTGYWSLTQLWMRLIRNIPAHPRGPHAQCTAEEHAKRCKVEWEEAWLAASASRHVAALHASDVLGRLAALHVELGMVYEMMSVRCGVNSASIVPSIRSQVEDMLVDLFVGPPTTRVGDEPEQMFDF
jgi:hypothetical protein